MRIDRLAVAAALILLGPMAAMAQVRPGLITISAGAASSPAEMDAASARVEGLVADGRLRLQAAYPDRLLSGRSHERLSQHYRGVPVQGGGVTRQLVGGRVVSIFGKIHTGIDLDPVPVLSAADATAIVVNHSGVTQVGDESPHLVVLPRLNGGYDLAYAATMRDFKIYFVDARSGRILLEMDAYRQESEVGTGTGAQGDQKKFSASRAGSEFQAWDRLRPTQIRTLDSRGSEDTLFDLLSGAWTAGDLADDADNTWTQASVVDGHVHTGWTHDYFFKRHDLTGIDGNAGNVFNIVSDANVPFTLFNALFFPPPFGPQGRGAIAWGSTADGTPINTLDIAAHEFMHGVAHFGVARRTGGGLFSMPIFDGVGPTSANFQGQAFPCDTTTVVFGDGTSFPVFCDNGRYALASNHTGAIDEAFADVFGASVEIFFQPPGAGPLRADYLMGEDIEGFGPIRALDVPGQIRILTSGAPIPYPDHYSNRLRLGIMITQGTRANPIEIAVAPFVIRGGSLLFVAGTDSGGVHWNATILGHAFFLAIEGGRNATSGISLVGVGDANRAKVERVFLRAMTELMPDFPTLQMAAAALRQSATDLFGPSAVTASVNQALRAVGL